MLKKSEIERTIGAMQETWVPSLGWESPREGKGYPLQYAGLENSMDCIVLGGGKELDTTE